MHAKQNKTRIINYSNENISYSDPRTIMLGCLRSLISPWVPDLKTYFDMHAALLKGLDTFQLSIANSFEWCNSLYDPTANGG